MTELARDESWRPQLHGLRVETGARRRADANIGAVGEAVGSSGIEGTMGRGEDGLVWTAGGHGELDPTNADGDEGTDLEQTGNSKDCSAGISR